jgi:hypothetical protein
MRLGSILATYTLQAKIREHVTAPQRKKKNKIDVKRMALSP